MTNLSSAQQPAPTAARQVEMAPERGESGGPGEEGVALASNRSTSPSVYIKEGDGAAEAPRRTEDDDLTSLTWLQDKNLLKGINLRRSGGGGGLVVGKDESPTSDYGEECSPSEQGTESTCSSVTSSSPLPQQQHQHPCGHPQSVSAAPQPPSAVSATPPAAALKNRHPHHIPYDPKIHVTSKPPYSFSCLIFMSIEDSKGKALPVKEIYTWILDHFPYYRNAPTGWKNSVRHNLSLNKCFRKVDKAPNLGKGSLWMVDPVFRPNLVQALMKAPYHPYTNVERNISAAHFNRSRVRGGRGRGGGGGGGSEGGSSGGEEEEVEEGEEVPLDEEDAAAAMLVLKHGPHAATLHIRRDEYHRRYKLSPSISFREDSHRLSYRKEEELNSNGGRQPADHTYSTVESTIEPDEAFMEGSDSNSTCSLHIQEEEEGWRTDDPEEERRKTAEGADALLNLAGIKTSGVTPTLVDRKRRLLQATLTTSSVLCPPAPAKVPRRPGLQQRLKAKR